MKPVSFNKYLHMRFIVALGLLLSGSTVMAQADNGYKVEPLLKTDTSYLGGKLIYPAGDSTETTIIKVTFPPGYSTGWHKHDHPLFGYVLQGELTVETRERAPYVMKAGTAAAEVTGTWHNGSNKGSTDTVMIVVYLGKKGHPVSVKQESY